MTVISLEERLAKELAGRREDVAWGIASGAAEDMEDED